MLEEVHASEVSLEARGSDVEEGGVAAGAAPIRRKLSVYDEVGAGSAVNPFANRTPDLPATTWARRSWGYFLGKFSFAVFVPT